MIRLILYYELLTNPFIGLDILKYIKGGIRRIISKIKVIHKLLTGYPQGLKMNNISLDQTIDTVKDVLAGASDPQELKSVLKTLEEIKRFEDELKTEIEKLFKKNH